jgi:hypothetical protein
LGSKQEWSIVQAVEWQHREKPINKIEIVRMNGSSVLGVPVTDSRKEIWIMLNAGHPPYYNNCRRGLTSYLNKISKRF